MPTKLRVVFYCIGNSCRSPMAEAICRHLGGEAVEAQSAGVSPLGHIADGTYKALAVLNIPAGALYSKPLSAVRIGEKTLVISLDSKFTVRRVFGPNFKFDYDDWDIRDPYGASPALYLQVAQDLYRRIKAMLKHHGITTSQTP